VLSGALGFARLVCCGLVIASFAMFADDQINGASKHQVAEIAGQSASRTGTGTVVDPDPGQPRRFIDQTASTLTAPFRAVVHSGSQWVQRGFATLCALLVYGFGLGYLTRFSQGRATRSRYRPSPRS
jgi:hypothetical protein